LLIRSLRSRRVRPFLGEGALGVVWGVATACVGLADGGEVFFLALFATCAHVDGAGVGAVGGGGGGGGGGLAVGCSGVDPEASAAVFLKCCRSSRTLKFLLAQLETLAISAACLSSDCEYH